MGFGKSKSESKQEFDPQLKQALLSVFNEGQRLYNTMQYQPYLGAAVAPFSNIEMRGMQGVVDRAQKGYGKKEMTDAMGLSRGLLNVLPRNVQEHLINKSMLDDARYNIGPTERITTLPKAVARDVAAPGALGVDQVGAETFRNTDLDPYINPYEEQVVGGALGDIERARQIQQNRNAAAAVGAGAFGGDRQAILEAETNKAALEQTAKTAAALRQSGFESAAQRVESDANRRLSADRLNQAANLTGGQFTRGQQLDADRLNQAATLSATGTNAANVLRAAEANQATALAGAQSDQRTGASIGLANQKNLFDTRRANQDAVMRARLANQRRDLEGNDARLRAANQLARLGGDYRNLMFQDPRAMMQIGGLQRDQAQRIMDDQYRRFMEAREWPLRMFDVLRGAAGILPNPLTTKTKGKSTELGIV